MKYLICGRSEDVLPTIPSEAVTLIFTSPPYAVGKDYEPDIRIGVLLQLLNDTFRECRRILQRGGYMVVNFGDIIPAKEILGTEGPCEMPMGWIYWSLGLANGLVLQAQRVWHKDFSKITGGKHAISAPRPVPEFEHLYTFRKIEGAPKEQVIRNRQLSQRAVWSTVGEKHMAVDHPAAFPESLVQRVIEVYTDPGDVVLDPFAGSGTVGVVAKQMDREYILIEKEPGYCDVARLRLEEVGDSPAESIEPTDILDLLD